MTFSFSILTPSIFAQSSQSWCLSETRDQELSKTVPGSVIRTLFDEVTALQSKRALFLGHPVDIIAMKSCKFFLMSLLHLKDKG